MRLGSSQRDRMGRMMSEDEKLSGILDGELGPEELAEMEAVLECDATLKARLAEMRRADDLARIAYAEPMDEGVPDRFMKAIDAGLATPASNMSDNIVSIGPHAKTASNDNPKNRWRVGGAIAASLMFGVLLGTQFTSGNDGELTTKKLNEALNTVPSTQSASLATGVIVTPRLSFARAGGGYCRQFDLTGKTGAKAGVACRKDKYWTIEALMPSGQTASAEGGYIAAEGPTDNGIESVIGKLRAGDPFDAAAEADVITRGWK